MWQKHVSFRPLRWSNFQFVIPGHQIFKNSHHKNPIGHIRWPIIFFSLCMICTAEKLSICLYFSILRILSFQCPGMTHITNLTRMPLHRVRVELILNKLPAGEAQRSPAQWLHFHCMFHFMVTMMMMADEKMQWTQAACSAEMIKSRTWPKFQ